MNSRVNELDLMCFLLVNAFFAFSASRFALLAPREGSMSRGNEASTTCRFRLATFMERGVQRGFE